MGVRENSLSNYDPTKSAQSCGCDEGANHRCEQHYLEPRPRGPLTSDFSKPIVETHDAVILGIKDSGKRVTYASGSMRDPSTGKIKWSRIPFGPMMRRWAQHLTTAEAKYPDPTPGYPNFMLIDP